MKVVMLTNHSHNQKALAAKIHQAVGLSGIVYSKNIPKKKKGLLMRAQVLANRIQGRMFGQPFVDAWSQLQKHYDQYSIPRDMPSIKVDNINDPKTIEFLKEQDADLVVVSGTNLVGKAIIEFSNTKEGTVNLHTGISPYVKGGPNCTNWCLAKKKFHMIGSTVMWIDLGIDTGNIICTDRVPLDGGESLYELHYKVMEHAHDIYVRSIKKIVDGQPITSVSQNSICEGETFYSWEWSGLQMRKALKNFEKHFNKELFASPGFRQKVKALKLISI